MNCKGRKADEESASECDIIGQSQKGERCILSKKKKKKVHYHCALLVWWSLHEYKCLWGIGDKDWDSSLQGGDSHTYTLRLG